jgi:hypothetical protein
MLAKVISNNGDYKINSPYWEPHRQHSTNWAVAGLLLKPVM